MVDQIVSNHGDELTVELVWRALEEVKDPEIPVVSVVGMGIVREVNAEEQGFVIKITPTFSGCPAMQVIEDEVEACVRDLGAHHVRVEVALSPPWSSEWISEKARQSLKEFGIAPPARHDGRFELTFYEQVCCPYCDSINTDQKNSFGPTLCRAIFYCYDCQQPFEQFKALQIFKRGEIRVSPGALSKPWRPFPLRKTTEP